MHHLLIIFCVISKDNNNENEIMMVFKKNKANGYLYKYSKEIKPKGKSQGDPMKKTNNNILLNFIVT